MRATMRVQKSGVMERDFNGTQGTISHFTCAHIHTDSCAGGVGGLSHSRPGPMMCKPFLTFD